MNYPKLINIWKYLFFFNPLTILISFLAFSLSHDLRIDKGNTLNMHSYSKIGGRGKYFTIHFEVYNAIEISAYSTLYMQITSAKFSLKGQRIFRHNALSLCRILTCHVHCVLHALYSVCLRRPFILRNMINYIRITCDRSRED